MQQTSSKTDNGFIPDKEKRKKPPATRGAFGEQSGANYLVLRQSVAVVAGSSMGGLMSLYVGLKHLKVVSKIGVFSPALWFAQDSVFAYVRRTKLRQPVQFYLVAGEQESETMVPLMAAMRDSLRQAGVKPSAISYRAVADGKHAEWFWRRISGCISRRQWGAKKPVQTAEAHPVAAPLNQKILALPE